jgi:hypothetical protein
VIAPASDDDLLARQSALQEEAHQVLAGLDLAGPGDAVCLLALRDAIIIVTSCAVDYPPLNGGQCTAIRIDISADALA